MLGLAAAGALALRQADASDDDDDDDEDQDNSGPGGGGDDDGGGDSSGGDNHSGHDGDDDDDDDDGDGDDDVIITGTVPTGAVEIRIVDDDADGFSPGTVTVDVGAAVTFVNADDDAHTATGAGFDTGIIQPGGDVTVVLDTPGTWFYACLIHPEMTGTIIVRDASSAVTGATPNATPGATPAAATPTGSGGTTVAIRDFAFEPPEITIPAGTTVSWENADAAPHTATGDDGVFSSGRIDAGAAGTATFDEVGTFAYRCEFHPDMLGTIVVT